MASAMQAEGGNVLRKNAVCQQVFFLCVLCVNLCVPYVSRTASFLFTFIWTILLRLCRVFANNKLAVRLRATAGDLTFTLFSRTIIP